MNQCIYLIGHIDIEKSTYLLKYLLGTGLIRQVRFCNSVVCAHRGSDLLPTSSLRIMKQTIVRACHTDYSHLFIVVLPGGSLQFVIPHTSFQNISCLLVWIINQHSLVDWLELIIVQTTVNDAKMFPT